MRVTCFIGSLSCGGAQRSLLILAEHLSRRGHDITLMTHASRGESDFFAIPAGVWRVYADPAASVDCRWFDFPAQQRRRRAFRESLIQTRADVVLGFITINNIRILQALEGTGIPVVACERSDPRICPINWRWRILQKKMYPKAAAVVIQSTELLDWARAEYPQWKTVAICNPVLPPPEPKPPRPQFFQREHNLVSLGRLAEEKRYDHLLKAYSSLAAEFPDWQLTIGGEGPERTALESLIRELNLTERVELPGQIQEPYGLPGHADLFAMTSRFEGFPNTLAEAMACGVPAVSYDCPSGPRQIIRPEIDGILVKNGDIEELSQALASLMGDSHRRELYGTKAREVVERFRVEDVIDQWEGILHRARE